MKTAWITASAFGRLYKATCPGRPEAELQRVTFTELSQNLGYVISIRPG
jgi:hypothetical protein